MLKESEIRIIKVIWKQRKLERVNDLEQSLERDIQELPDFMQESVLKEFRLWQSAPNNPVNQVWQQNPFFFKAHPWPSILPPYADI